MSISSISSSNLLDTTLSTILTAATASTTSTAPSSSSSTGGTSALDKLAQDLADLLKQLAAGDVAASKTDLQKLQADAKAQIEASTTTGATSATSSPSAFSNLLTDLAKSLSTGDTSGALTSLTSFLLGAGQTSGNLLDTTA